RTYTTHDIAKVCDVYPSSVINWIESGKLKAYATPGGHNRVTRENLLAFLDEFGIPVPKKLAAREMRVLVVDDDVEITRVVARAFSRSGGNFALETCHSGIEALIRIGQNPPDLVVLDIVLPKMDGQQVCRVLKAQTETKDIKIIAISGDKPPFNEKKPQEAKIDAFFRKPLDLLALLAKSAELLGIELGMGEGK
ncbi:MAG: response regulator, partial [Elusimicrobia bacterium]|nr:response regulator [Elusimicrobiota bacterium]